MRATLLIPAACGSITDIHSFIFTLEANTEMYWDWEEKKGWWVIVLSKLEGLSQVHRGSVRGVGVQEKKRLSGIIVAIFEELRNGRSIMWKVLRAHHIARGEK